MARRFTVPRRGAAAGLARLLAQQNRPQRFWYVFSYSNDIYAPSSILPPSSSYIIPTTRPAPHSRHLQLTLSSIAQAVLQLVRLKAVSLLQTAPHRRHSSKIRRPYLPLSLQLLVPAQPISLVLKNGPGWLPLQRTQYHL